MGSKTPPTRMSVRISGVEKSCHVGTINEMQGGQMVKEERKVSIVKSIANATSIKILGNTYLVLGKDTASWLGPVAIR